MPESSCFRCRSAIPMDAPQGLCPNCLFGQVLAESTPADDSSSTRQIHASETVPDRELHPYGLVLPGYELLEELGRGGMGVVFKARQVGLDRVVAVKLVRAGATLDSAQRERFASESRAMALVKHPNVVQVYDVGETEGMPYFSLEYVDGGSLAARLRANGPIPIRQAAEFSRSIACAIAEAHAAGVLHRDLKPANILLAGSTENPVPKVTDFGLAKWLDSADGPTSTGAIMGTPSYMAPEQASGRIRELGPAVDIYAVGATLYELLTGQPPFRAESAVATLALVVNASPVSPRVLRPELSGDLEAICLKCLEKSLGNRYQTALELADDLGRWLRGESTLARPLTRWQRGWRTFKRRRRAVAAVLGSLLLALTAAMVVWLRVAPPDPDAPLRELEETLRRDGRVSLVGDTGLPKWYRWALGPATLAESGPDLGANASFQTGTRSLLELFPKPPASGYHFTADIRMDRNLGDVRNRPGVGLYVLHRREQFPTQDEVHQFVLVEFNEIWVDSERPENYGKLVKPKPGQPQHGHRALVRDVDVDRHPPRNQPGLSDELSENGASLGGFVHEPASAPWPWRTVRIEVTPAEIRIAWRLGQEEWQKNRAIPIQELANNAAYRADRYARLPNPLVLDRGPRPVVSPLGIVAKFSMVSFRNVVLEAVSP